MINKFFLLWLKAKRLAKRAHAAADEAMDVLQVTLDALADGELTEEEKAMIVAEAQEAAEAWKELKTEFHEVL